MRARWQAQSFDIQLRLQPVSVAARCHEKCIRVSQRESAHARDDRRAHTRNNLEIYI